MGMSFAVQRRIQVEDRRIDPRCWAVWMWLCARFHDAIKGSVSCYPENVPAHRSREAFWHVKCLKRQDPAQVWVHKKKLHVFARIRHRENTAAVAIEKIGRIEPVRHALLLLFQA